MKRFEIVRDIDEGAFGIVQMARNRETGEIVAIKKIKRRYNNWEECMSLREIKSLKRLRHPHIIKLKEVFKQEQELFLVFEFCRTNLFRLYSDEYKTKGAQMPEPLIKSLVFQTASALAHMHKQGFFHRDLKPENLLITDAGGLKIADFGLAREIRSSPPYTDYVSTRWYRAPEILLKSTNYNSPVDIFALGCIMAELYLQAPLFNGASEIDQLSKIFAVLGGPGKSWPEGTRLASQIGFGFPATPALNLADVVKNASPTAVDLLRQMLNYDSSKRPTAAKVLQHPYFRDVNAQVAVLASPPPALQSQAEPPQRVSLAFGAQNFNNTLNKKLNQDATSERLRLAQKPAYFMGQANQDRSGFNLELPQNQREKDSDYQRKLDKVYQRPAETGAEFAEPPRATPRSHNKGFSLGQEQTLKSNLTSKKRGIEFDIEELENEILSSTKKYESPRSFLENEQKENFCMEGTQFGFQWQNQQPVRARPANSFASNKSPFNDAKAAHKNIFNDQLEELLFKEQQLLESKEEKNATAFGQARANAFKEGQDAGFYADRRNNNYGFEEKQKSRLVDPQKMGGSSSMKQIYEPMGMDQANMYSYAPSYLTGVNVLNKLSKVNYQANH